MWEKILPMRPDQSIMGKKSKKGIYGNASSKDIKELKEEGIETTAIPWLKKEEN